MAEGWELAKAYVQIVPSAQGIKGKITEELGGEAESAGQSAGESIAKKIKAAIAAAGIGMALKAAISEGAALEQSIGGIETLFGDSADKMKDYASQAYKTAGISANSYMEQATGFAASLLQSLGGNTAAAADAANQAIIDMADNSNKMGTSLESIQNAYSGFAKQNYTMLDNLKLGYGGTKEEMERLLADAQAFSGVEYNIDNLADVYSAIHVVQEELGITGSTALEASETLSGSMASMKAAAQDFLGNLALGQNVEESLGALVNTASTFLFDNLLPAVGNVITAVPGVIGTVITEHLPTILENGTTLIQTIANGIAEGVPEFAAKAPEAIQELLNQLISCLPAILESGLTVLNSLTDGFIDGLPGFISAATSVLTNLLQTVIQHLPEIIESGVQIIVKLATGLVKAIPEIVKAIPKLIKAIIEGFANVDWPQVGKDIIEGIKGGIVSMATSLASSVKDAAKNALNAAKNFLGIHSPSTVFRDEVGKMMGLGLVEGIEDTQNAVKDAVSDIEKTASVPMQVAQTAQMTDTGFSAVRQNEDLLANLTRAIEGNTQDNSKPFIVQLTLDKMILAQLLVDPIKQVSRFNGDNYVTMGGSAV